MIIVRNSAKCTACDVEIESTHRHDFATHYCKVEPTLGKEWVDGKLVDSGKITYRFAVDGGHDYIRRVGNPEFYTDTSIETD